MSTAGIQPKLQVAFAGTFAARLEQPVRAYLRLPCDVIVDDEARIVSRLSDVDVLVTMAFTREMSSAATRLKLVQVPGAGLDRIDRSVLPAGAWLANVYGHETGIAEYVLGAMLTLSRDFARLDAALRRGIWESQCVARRARTFDMEICAIRRDVARSAADELALLGGLEIVDEVLQRSDYLVISLPVTPETHGLIGKKQLHAMKPTAVLVNVSRAEILDEEALYHALAARTIAGAALDVWYGYPTTAGPTRPARQPFHELSNVLMTPHVSGWTNGMIEARAMRIADNIHRAARGEPPVHLIPTARA